MKFIKDLKLEWDKSIIKAKRLEEAVNRKDDEVNESMENCSTFKEMYHVANSKVSDILNQEVSVEEVKEYRKYQLYPLIFAILTTLIILVIYIMWN